MAFKRSGVRFPSPPLTWLIGRGRPVRWTPRRENARKCAATEYDVLVGDRNLVDDGAIRVGRRPSSVCSRVSYFLDKQKKTPRGGIRGAHGRYKTRTCDLHDVNVAL